MPKPGDAITEAEVTQFYVADGESVAEGDRCTRWPPTKSRWISNAPASGVVRWKVDGRRHLRRRRALAVIEAP